MYKYLSILVTTLALAHPITPIPLEADYNKEKAHLGKKLFFDTGLSNDNTISCASCHLLPGNGANSTAYSYGVNGSEGDINSPTVLNSVYNFVQFWDGRAKDLQDQVKGPVHNPLEMGSTMDDVVAYVKSKPLYRKAFKKSYKKGVTVQNVANAIAEFEKALITPNARFDQYLRGNENILTPKEKEGYLLFKELGCISCHNGRNIGGNMYQKIGIIIPYRHKGKGKLGRFEVTGNEEDKMVFKVPSLRNVAQTAPYLHDGTAATLEDAVNDMFEHQLGRIPTEASVAALVAFLKTLSGESPKILKEGL